MVCAPTRLDALGWLTDHPQFEAFKESYFEVRCQEEADSGHYALWSIHQRYQTSDEAGLYAAVAHSAATQATAAADAAEQASAAAVDVEVFCRKSCEQGY